MKRPRERFAPLLPPDEAGRRLSSFRKRAEQLEREMAAATKEKAKAKLDQLTEARYQLCMASLPAGVPAAYAVADGPPVDMYVHVRGDVEQRGPVVKRNVPKFLSGAQPLVIPQGTSGRLQLAQWLTRVDNPLTARVLVNRIWQHHFGKGLVTTPSNFGLRGEPPTHPELLDWLTAQFIESGWSMKALHRLILASKTYQLSSDYDAADAGRDPANDWYWRHDRRRLDAEAIRDALLAVSGNLDRRRPGPHPFPPLEKWIWTQHVPFKEVYPSRQRSVYLMTQRFQRHPYLGLFDGPDTNTSQEERTTSTVPQQALFLMNNPFMVEQAESFARRLLAAGHDRRRRIELAYQLAWSRPPAPIEYERDAHYVDAYEKHLDLVGVPAGRKQLEAWTSYGRILLSANEFFYID